MKESANRFSIAMLSVHSSPLGELGSKDTGGMSVYIRELARELAQAGHRIDIYTRADKKNQARKLKIAENVCLIHLDAGGDGPVPKNSLHLYLADFFESLEKYRSREGLSYDIIHSHYWLSGAVGSMAQSRWDVPHVVTFHTTGMAKKAHCSEEQESRIRLLSEKALSHECSRIFATTEKERTLLSKYFAVPGEKIGLVPCGVNLDNFQPIPRDLARERLGLQQCGPVVLYVGRFAPVKGMDRLMASMVHMKKDHNLKLVIVGGEGARSGRTAGLKHHARKLGIHNNILFAGRVDHKELSSYYSAADVLVLPSYYESFGLVALESLACGTPVVATRVGAMDAFIQSGKTGEIVDFPSPHGIALAIEKVLLQKERGDFPPGRIRASVTGHDWQKIAACVSREYSAVTEAHDSGNGTIENREKVAYGTIQ